MNWLDLLVELAIGGPWSVANEKSLHSTVRDVLEDRCVACGRITIYARPGLDGRPRCHACLTQQPSHLYAGHPKAQRVPSNNEMQLTKRARVARTFARAS